MDLLSIGLTEWVLGGALLLLLVLYKLGTWNHNHFSSRGVKNPKPWPFIGSMAPALIKGGSVFDVITQVANSFKDESLVGAFQFHTPVLVVKDPELIKRITVKDFEHFTDHPNNLSEHNDFLFSNNLVFLKGERWRDMRTALSPAFTSSKMKRMFTFMDSCGQQLADYLQEEINKQEPGKVCTFDMKELFTRFTNDVIASTAFGIQIDTLKEKENEFYRMGHILVGFSTRKSLVFLGYMLFPKLMEMLRMKFLSDEETSFFVNLVRETLRVREMKGIVRHDMIHLLMQARRGELKAEAGDEEGGTKDGVGQKKMDLTEDDIAAQVMIFFFAGFDTVSTLLSFTSMMVAIHEDVQKRLVDEIDDVMGDDSKITYEKVMKMKYLDMVLSETLRLHPPMPATDRTCTKDYTFQANDKWPEYTIRKGEDIWLPQYSLHLNPEYYPEPYKFDPERFSEDNKRNIKPYTYFPFGIGPRVCIGQRFSLLETKVALVHILSRFNLVVVEKTPLPLKISTKGFTISVEGGFWIGAKERQPISS